MSGIIIDARDHVRITALLSVLRAASTFFASLGCTYGPFFIDLDITTSHSPTDLGPSFV
jgi:hypothetical protein